MVFIRNTMIGFLALAMLPLAAQGQTARAVQTDSLQAPATLDRADLEAWLDGYLLNALERGRIVAVVVLVQGGKILPQLSQS